MRKNIQWSLTHGLEILSLLKYGYALAGLYFRETPVSARTVEPPRLHIAPLVLTLKDQCLSIDYSERPPGGTYNEKSVPKAHS